MTNRSAAEKAAREIYAEAVRILAAQGVEVNREANLQNWADIIERACGQDEPSKLVPLWQRMADFYEWPDRVSISAHTERVSQEEAADYYLKLANARQIVEFLLAEIRRPRPCGETAWDTKVFTCPKCEQPLKKVEYPSDSMLNRYQWMSVRAGDYYCACHNNHTGNRPYAYFWEKDLAALPSPPTGRTEAK